ncbi:MAG: SpoIIIAH-like family protein [Oscillospiraceae bacterium]|nr:SpoIIIAH-like family protein [Oscillospiraceae bacterium]
MKKKTTVAAIVILFLCVAVYLNLNTADLGSDEERIMTTLGEQNAEEAPAEVVTEDKKKYFEEARLEKQKARDSAITTLKEAAKEENMPEDSRDRAAKSIETISNGAISETRIETLIKAKGFGECVALMNEKGVNVIVSAPEGGLAASDTTKIKDIVVSETGISPSQIKIIEIK